MRSTEPVLYFTLGLVASGAVYCVGKKAIAPTGQPSAAVSSGGLKRMPRNSLPLMAPKARLSVDADQKIQIHANTGPEWELNPKAPSWMALFEKGQSQADYLQTQEISQTLLMQPEFSIGDLKVGNQYLLQGTLYLCKKTDHSACTMKSYSYELEPTAIAPGRASQRVVELKD